MSKLNIGGVVEEVITSEEFTLEKARKVLKDEVVAIIGYGVQGRGQALNLRDNGINVIIGEEYNTKKAIEEGWVPGKNLFPLMEAAKRGTILQYLMSDAQQTSMWPELKPHLTKGKALYFSHGFSIVYKEQTGVIPPADIDVIKVENLTDVETVKRELVLIRMSLTADSKSELIRKINQLNCKILTFNTDHCVLEYRGSKAEVDRVLETLKPLGIDDIARTGIAALERKN